MATKTFCSVCGTETEGEDLCPECEALSRPTAEFRERTATENEPEEVES